MELANTSSSPSSKFSTARSKAPSVCLTSVSLRCSHPFFLRSAAVPDPLFPFLLLAGYQKALLTTELAQIFAAAPANPVASALASAGIREAYRKAEGIEGEADKFGDLKGSGGIPVKKMPDEDGEFSSCSGRRSREGEQN